MPQMDFTGISSGSAGNIISLNTNRIYDSCADRDCIENVPLLFTADGQRIIDAAATVRARRAETIAVHINIEPMSFNKGFFCVELTYFFKISMTAAASASGASTAVDGLCIGRKSVVLFGSESSVRTFSSKSVGEVAPSALPIVTVQAVDPLILSTGLTPTCTVCDFGACIEIPPEVRALFSGSFDGVTSLNSVLISLGIFSIIQMERPAQLLVPTYGFVVPDKESKNVEESPCELFSRLPFPAEEFFPPCQEETISE